MNILSESYEENDDDKDNSSDLLVSESLFSTSLEEKSIIFGNIRQEVEKIDESVLGNKTFDFLFEIKLSSLQRYYRRKYFQMVMRQLVKDYEMRHNHKKWKLLIESF